MRYQIDGDALRLTTDYYSEVQHSPALWLSLTDELAQRIIAKNDVNVMSCQEWKAIYRRLYMQLASRHCRNLGLRPDGHFGPCGFCDVCEINRALE